MEVRMSCSEKILAWIKFLSRNWKTLIRFEGAKLKGGKCEVADGKVLSSRWVNYTGLEVCGIMSASCFYCGRRRSTELLVSRVCFFSGGSVEFPKFCLI